MPRMTAQDKQWEAEQAARTLVEHAKITSNPGLHKRAVGLIAKQAVALNKVVKAAPKATPPKRK